MREWVIGKGYPAATKVSLGSRLKTRGCPTILGLPSQMDSYQRGVAAILMHIGAPAQLCAGHKEYALPAGRKDDPSFSMDQFRSAVTALVAGTATIAPLIPSSMPNPLAGQLPLQTLRRGSTGLKVNEVQSTVGVSLDGVFGSQTEAAVRAFQRQNNLVPDGIVGPKTWAIIVARSQLTDSPG